MPGATPSSEAAERWRLRLSRDAAAALSHLDQVAALRRALSAGGLPLAAAGGRRTAPKLAFGPALGAGQESEAEYVDVWLARRMKAPELRGRVEGALPAGYRLLEARKIPLFYPSVESLATLAVAELRWEQPPQGPGPSEGPRSELKHPAVVKLERDVQALRMTYRIGPGGARAEDILEGWLGESWKNKFKLKRKALLVEAPSGEMMSP